MAPDLRHPPAHHRERSSEAGRPSFHAVSASPYVLVFEHGCFHRFIRIYLCYQYVSQCAQNEQKSMLYFEQLVGGQIFIIDKLLFLISRKHGKGALRQIAMELLYKYAGTISLRESTPASRRRQDYSTGVGKNDRTVVRLWLKES